MIRDAGAQQAQHHAGTGGERGMTEKKFDVVMILHSGEDEFILEKCNETGDVRQRCIYGGMPHD